MPLNKTSLFSLLWTQYSSTGTQSHWGQKTLSKKKKKKRQQQHNNNNNKQRRHKLQKNFTPHAGELFLRKKNASRKKTKETTFFTSREKQVNSFKQIFWIQFLNYFSGFLRSGTFGPVTRWLTFFCSESHAGPGAPGVAPLPSPTPTPAPSLLFYFSSVWTFFCFNNLKLLINLKK